MNKDEMKMIEEMAKTISDCSMGDCVFCNGRHKCIYYKSAETLYNAGCRIIGEDEIVAKRSELGNVVISHERADLVDMLNQETRELQRANTIKQEKRDILQAINKYLVGTRGIYTIKTFRNCRFEDLMLVRADDLETLVKKLAKEHDVELED